MLNDMTVSEPAEQKESEFVKTPVANLVRSRSSGNLFARIRIKGKLIRKTLETKSVHVAQMRLVELETRERQRVAHATAFVAGKMSYTAWNLKMRIAGSNQIFEPIVPSAPNRFFHIRSLL